VSASNSLLEEVDGVGVPRGGEPLQSDFLRVAVDLGVFLDAELDAVLVVDVGHLAPRGRADLRLLVFGHGDLGVALLELHGLRAGGDGDIHELLGDLDVSVVVDADLTDHVHGLVRADEVIPDGHGGELISHETCFRLARAEAAWLVSNGRCCRWTVDGR
jgi:hypothetical protein